MLGIFQNRFLWIFGPGWLWAMIFLFFASWVARVIDVSH
jgi:hypothetical protein